MLTVRPCRDDELTTVLAIINAAAEAYRDVIPVDRWHEPYMSLPELRHEIASRVSFWGCEADGELIGVMGAQPVREVDLIRHAYVRPDHQRQGAGAALIEHLRRQSRRRMLVGTWADATWAIDFYRRRGFSLVPTRDAATLLRAYWSIPERQIETSVVLANPPLSESDRRQLAHHALETGAADMPPAGTAATREAPHGAVGGGGGSPLAAGRTS